MPMTTADFDYIRDLVHKQAAIVIEKDSDYLVEARMPALLLREGISSVHLLVERLHEQQAGPLRQRLVEAMTTNETSFFRDVYPFDALRRQIIPLVMDLRSRDRSLNIWCGACSTGQEPYSIAMTLREHFPELASWKVRIIATDISSNVLAKAKSGQFDQLEIKRGLPEHLLSKYFSKDGKSWRVVDELRAMIDFRHLNLLESFGTLPTLDIVFLVLFHALIALFGLDCRISVEVGDVSYSGNLGKSWGVSRLDTPPQRKRHSYPAVFRFDVRERSAAIIVPRLKRGAPARWASDGFAVRKKNSRPCMRGSS